MNAPSPSSNGSKLIARIWHGVTDAGRADEYADYLERTGAKECRATPGNRGVYVLRRIRQYRAELTFISLWESFDAIRRFAGAKLGENRIDLMQSRSRIAPARPGTVIAWASEVLPRCQENSRQIATRIHVRTPTPRRHPRSNACSYEVEVARLRLPRGGRRRVSPPARRRP